MVMHSKICRICQAAYIGDGRRSNCDSCLEAIKKTTAWKAPACAVCAKPIKHRIGRSKTCARCKAKVHKLNDQNYEKKLNDKARSITRCAVRVGFLPHPLDFKCVDCGNPAQCYDHRDYSKPLDVVPVCLPCNASRGRGIPLLSAPCYDHINAQRRPEME